MNTDENHNEENIINTVILDDEENTHSEDVTQLFVMEDNETSQDRSSPAKRGREDDEWTEVRSRQYRMREVRGVTELSVSCKDKFPKQFALAKLFKEQGILNITKVKHINPYKIIIELSNADSVDKLINSDHFNGLGWRFQRPFEVGLSYGVIKNIDLDILEDELFTCLSSTCHCKIVNVKRLQRRDKEAATWIDSETWRIGFEGPSLPPYVFLYEMRVSVEPYVFPVTQCTRCWRYGHSLRMCPTIKVTCLKCAGKHNVDNCKTGFLKCINCSKNHMALDKTCPVYMREKKIRSIMSEFNVSYRKAMDIYVPPAMTSYETDVNTVSQTPTMISTTPMSPVLQSKTTYAQKTAVNKVSQAPTMTSTTPMSPVLQSKTTYAQKTARHLPTKEPITNQGGNIPQTDKPQMEEEEETIKRNNKKKQKKKSPQSEIPHTRECDMDIQEDTWRGDATEDHTSEEDAHSFGWLVDKIKNILFFRNDTLKNKIMSVVQIIVDWAISYFLKKTIPNRGFSFKNMFPS